MPEGEYEDGAFYWVRHGDQWTIALRDYQRGPGDFVWFLPGDADPRPEDAFDEIGPCLGKGPPRVDPARVISALKAELNEQERELHRIALGGRPDTGPW